ncbi:hypothetical protein DdX_15522 [Ditylenchus destructor]|uniref:Uncharacterized protein n=1 Tax=Ditylenchus destructor TaxID=166010 RepID=A0AAD4MUT7_9BILA|nr:hypothetical protein DdX_15522 [Ditylenchus destructor]
MKYYSTLLILAIFSPASAFYIHNRTLEKERLNAKIKEEFPEILAITSPGGHDNLHETLDEILELPLKDFSRNQLLILDHLKGYVVHNKHSQDLESNLLAPLLPPPEYEQAGEIDDPSKIYNFMGELADRYVELLKEEGEDKVIHVVPIAKVKDESIIFFGVLGKRKGTANNLTGIAGLVARIK